MQTCMYPEKSQPYGNRSKETLSKCAFGQNVEIDYKKVDRYKRKLGKVTVGAIDCNLNQIKLGVAWHYKKYQKEQTFVDRRIYAEAEKQAQSSRSGLWAAQEQMAPWEFREAVKTKRYDPVGSHARNTKN